MANVEVRVNGTLLPGDLTDMKRSDELFWSEGTGRSATTGTLSGSIVARKATYQLDWGPVTKAQYDAIRAACDAATFMTLQIRINTLLIANLTVYRSNITGDLLQAIGSDIWYKGVSVQFVEV